MLKRMNVKGGGGGIGTLCPIEQNLFVHQLW